MEGKEQSQTIKKDCLGGCQIGWEEGRTQITHNSNQPQAEKENQTSKRESTEDTEEEAMEGITENEDMSRLLEKLKLEEDNRVVEVEDDDIEEANRDFENVIACKILTSSYINPEVFSGIMPKIWGLEGAVRVEKAGTNVYLCKFKRTKDKARICRGGPWIYDDAIIVFDEPKANCCVEALDFQYVSFWVHFHKLPRVCFCRKYAVALGNSIGEFEAAEVGANEKIEGETLRVKVKINIKESLKRGTNVKTGSMAEKKWIPITYEKLPDFCYYCGRLGHVVHECHEEGVERSKERNFGVDLRETNGSKGFYKSWRSETKQFRGRGFRGRGRGLFGRGAREDFKETGKSESDDEPIDNQSQVSKGPDTSIEEEGNRREVNRNEDAGRKRDEAGGEEGSAAEVSDRVVGSNQTETDRNVLDQMSELPREYDKIGKK